MTAATLRVVCDTVYLACLATWVGGLGFVLAIVDPWASRTMNDDSGRSSRRALWAQCLRAASTAGALALPAFLAVPLGFPEFRGLWTGIQAVLILIATLALLQAAHRLDSDRAAKPSRVVPVLVVVLGLGLLPAFAARPPSRTAGLATWPAEPPERLTDSQVR